MSTENHGVDTFSLAIEAFETFGTGPHTVTPQLDIKRPESIDGLRFFQSALALAYRRGRQDLQSVMTPVGYWHVHSTHAPKGEFSTNAICSADMADGWTEQVVLAAAPSQETQGAAPTRCPSCNYRHGHRIGCENNPVDIALRGGT